MAGKGKQPKAGKDSRDAMSPVYKVKVPQAVLDRCEEGRGDLNLQKFFTRLLEFFAVQDDVIQGYMTGRIPPSLRVDVAELMLKRIAAERPPADVRTIPSPGHPPTFASGGRPPSGHSGAEAPERSAAG